MTSRIVHLESANPDLNKYLTELKQKYQVNLEKLKLENTDYESNIHDLDLKLRQAIVAREVIGCLAKKRIFIVLKRTS